MGSSGWEYQDKAPSGISKSGVVPGEGFADQTNASGK